MSQTSSAAPLAVITGATRGLGRALCARLIESGWTIAGCGRDAARVAQTRDELGAPHRVDVVDVCDARAVESWAQGVIAALGPPRLLLNNAAIINKPREICGISPEEFARVLNTNIGGVFHVLRAFVPAMCAAGRGVIVNFSSGWGRSTSPEVAPYCASKWAIEGLTQAFAQELPPGLAAVAFNPGIIDTDMLRTCWSDEAAHYPDAERWSRRATPYLLTLSARDNGRSVSAPGA
jgi:NAD(P)-dependent dehydrogenase (short-subunit alcohol dehydrogenase family)